MRTGALLTTALDYLIVFLVIFLGVNYGMRYFLHTEYPLAVPISDSMKPTINRYDLLIVRGVDPWELEVGDIIVFNAPWSRYPVVHRIVRIEVEGGELRFYTKGDAVPMEDSGYRKASDIYGKVVYRIGLRPLGWLLLKLKDPAVRIFLLACIAYMFIRDVYEKSKKKEGS